MLINRFIILLIILLSVTCLANGNASLEEQVNSIINETPAKQKTSKTNEGNEDSKTIMSFTSHKESNQNSKESKTAQETFLQMFCKFSATDLLLAIFTLLLVGVGVLQVKILRKSHEIAQINTELSIVTQRAYVLLKEIKTIRATDLKGDNVLGCQFLLSFENSGNTPAINMLIQIAQRISESNTPPGSKEYNFRFNMTETRKIAPRTIINVQPINISINEIINIYNGAKHLFIYGTIIYNDVMQKQPHTEMFCEKIGIIGNPTDMTVDPQVSFTTCPVPDDKGNS